MACGNVIKWYDLVPVISYLLLGGKCRNCKAKLSIQYPIIESIPYLYGVLVKIWEESGKTGRIIHAAMEKRHPAKKTVAPRSPFETRRGGSFSANLSYPSVKSVSIAT